MDKAGALDDIAPEVRAGKESDVLADLYALGRLTQSLLARCDPQALVDSGPLLLRALAEDPPQRPRDAEAFARELEAALRGPIAPVTGQAPAVPTGKDTERVEKLPPASTIEPSPFPDLPSRELVLESHKTIAEQVTHQMMKRGLVAKPLRILTGLKSNTLARDRKRGIRRRRSRRTGTGLAEAVAHCQRPTVLVLGGGDDPDCPSALDMICDQSPVNLDQVSIIAIE